MTPAGYNAPSVCSHCGDPLIADKSFCPNCGLLVGISPDSAALRAYVDAKLTEELNLRVKDSAGVVRDLADKVEDVVWGRLDRYRMIAGWSLAVIVALVAAIGFKSYSDIKDSVLKQIQPAVEVVEQRAAAAKKNIEDLQSRLPFITSSLDQVEREAQSQKQRVESADGQIANSLKSLGAAEAKAKADSDQFTSRVLDSQRQLDQITQSSQARIAQVAKAATQASVVQAYPMLNQEPQVLIANQEVSKKDKKPNEKWVSLVVSYAAVRENTYRKVQIEELISALKAAGYRVFIGTVSVTGHIGTGLERIGPNIGALDSEVFYYDPQKAAEANEIAEIASRHITTLGKRPILVNGSSEIAGFGAAIRYVEENSGLDAQIFLGPEKGQ